MNGVRKILRVLRRGPAFLCYASLCLAECLLQAGRRNVDVASRANILHRWNLRILASLGVEVSVVGPVPAQGLIVSNHLSYLDILVFSATAPCLFVSKREVKSWPLVGWVAALTGTVFIDRRSPSQTRRVWPQMYDRLQAGTRVVLFPEGTSTDGRQVLPFHSSLFEAAVTSCAPMTATYISYELLAEDGNPRMEVCYWGSMTMLPHLIKLLMKTNVRATIRFAEQAKVFTDRKQAALELQRDVRELGEPLGSSAGESCGVVNNRMGAYGDLFFTKTSDDKRARI
jgi:lyso-ornithine lipid O-acyltransferase